MIETVIFVVVLLILAVLLALLVLPIVALVRTGRIAGLAERLERVERELDQLGGLPPEPRLLPSPAATATASAGEPSRPAEAIPEVVAAGPAYRRPRPAVVPATEWATIEEWIGRRGLGWAAVVLLLFATAFFLKYAFENEWIGPLGRVSIGIVAGAGLCVAGWRRHRQGWRVFSQMLTAAGVVLLYLATFAAFGYYRLMPREQAGLYLVLLIGETAALALLYDAPAIALMAVIGGLLNPVLLSTGIDQYRSLFPYLIILNLGVLALHFARSWRAVGTVALLGTQLLFWAWYDRHYHPEKLAATIGFQLALFAVYLGHSVVRLGRPREPHGASTGAAGAAPRAAPPGTHPEDLVRLVLNAFLFAAAAYVLLDEQYHVWMGSLALALAIAYTGLGWLVQRRRPADYRHVLVSAATALAFVAAAFPLEASAAWIGLGWAVEGLVLWWFGLRIRSESLRGLAAVLLIMACIRLVIVDTPWLARAQFVPIFNKYAAPALAIAACSSAVALLSRRFRAREDFERVIQIFSGLAGVYLVWLILSLDTYQFCTISWPLLNRTVDRVTIQRTAQVSLSVLWALYAALILALGFRLQSSPLRWAALALFGLTLGKVFLVDMAGLPGFYRVIAFFVLAVMMGGAAWGYQKLDALSRAARLPQSTSSEGQHEPVA